MKTHHLLVLVGLLSVCPAFAENPSPPENLLKSLLSAVESNSIEKFVADGDTHFKTSITQEALSPVSTQLSPRIKSGYTTSYFGSLHQQGLDVYIWRLQFKDGGDDILAKLGVKDGKVGGFMLQ